MVQRASSTTMHVVIVIIQKKVRSYVVCASGDDFIPLTIETYGCFHFHFDSFFTTCVQIIVVHHRNPFSYRNAYFLLY